MRQKQLVAAATRLAETHSPTGALREWLLLFVDHMATKHGMSEALNSIVGGPSECTRVRRTDEAGHCKVDRSCGRERRHPSG